MIFMCCFCGETVDAGDHAAVQFSITNLWSEVGEAQNLFAHSKCAAGAIRDDVYFDPEMLQAKH